MKELGIEIRSFFNSKVSVYNSQPHHLLVEWSSIIVAATDISTANWASVDKFWQRMEWNHTTSWHWTIVCVMPERGRVVRNFLSVLSALRTQTTSNTFFFLSRQLQSQMAACVYLIIIYQLEYYDCTEFVLCLRFPPFQCKCALLYWQISFKISRKEII